MEENVLKLCEQFIENRDTIKKVFKGESVFIYPVAANALTELGEKGIRLIDKCPRKGAEGLNIGFLHPKSTGGVLTEICEKPECK